MIKKTVIILLLLLVLSAQYAGRPQWAAPTGLAFADAPNCTGCAMEDSMVFETYYPSPYGYYEELRGDKIIVGDTDNSRIDETHLPPSGTLTFEPKSYAEITNTGTSYEGAIYYDSFDHEFKYYDNNSSWQPLGGGVDYWKPSTASGGSNDIYYSQSGNVGIGTASPNTKLEVNGGIKIGNSSSICNTSNEGTIRYNATTKALELCNSLSWRAFTIENPGCGDWVYSYTISTPYVSNESLASADACKQWCSQKPGPSRTTACAWQKRSDFITTRCYSGYDASSPYYQDPAGWLISQATNCS